MWGVSQAFPQIGPASKDAASALIQALKDPGDRVREEAALGLGLMRLPVQDAIQEFRRAAASDPNPLVSSAAKLALKRIQSRE